MAGISHKLVTKGTTGIELVIAFKAEFAHKFFAPHVSTMADAVSPGGPRVSAAKKRRLGGAVETLQSRALCYMHASSVSPPPKPALDAHGVQAGCSGEQLDRARKGFRCVHVPTDLLHLFHILATAAHPSPAPGTDAASKRSRGLAPVSGRAGARQASPAGGATPSSSAAASSRSDARQAAEQQEQEPIYAPLAAELTSGGPLALALQVRWGGHWGHSLYTLQGGACFLQSGCAGATRVQLEDAKGLRCRPPNPCTAKHT